MPTNPEIPLEDYGNDRLDERLQSLFEKLLTDTAELLELPCPTDETILETNGAAFGKFGEDRITVSHSVAKSKISGNIHSGSVTFTNAENPDRSFFYGHEPRYSKLWLNAAGSTYTGRDMMVRLQAEWPIADDFSNDTVRNLAKASDDDVTGKRRNVPAQSIFEVLENYSVVFNTGEHMCTMKWNHCELNAAIVDGKKTEQRIVFSIISDQKDSLRKITADITVARPGIANRVTYYICADEIGNITVRADTLNQHTKFRDNVPVPDNDAAEIFEISQRLLERLVTVKTPRS